MHNRWNCLAGAMLACVGMTATALSSPGAPTAKTTTTVIKAGHLLDVRTGTTCNRRITAIRQARSRWDAYSRPELQTEGTSCIYRLRDCRTMCGFIGDLIRQKQA